MQQVIFDKSYSKESVKISNMSNSVSLNIYFVLMIIQVVCDIDFFMMYYMGRRKLQVYMVCNWPIRGFKKLLSKNFGPMKIEESKMELIGSGGVTSA